MTNFTKVFYYYSVGKAGRACDGDDTTSPLPPSRAPPPPPQRAPRPCHRPVGSRNHHVADTQPRCVAHFILILFLFYYCYFIQIHNLGVYLIRPTYRRYDGTITFIQRGVNVCQYVPLSGCPSVRMLVRETHQKNLCIFSLYLCKII